MSRKENPLMSPIETALLTALSRRLAGEGELALKTHTRADGSQFLTCERAGGFWGVPNDDVDALSEAMLNSLVNDLQHLSQEDIEKQFLNPAEMGRAGGLKGGKATTEAKRAASAANGKKGGRPKKVVETRDTSG